MFCLSWNIHCFFQGGWRLLYFFLSQVHSSAITIISKCFTEYKQQYYIEIALWLNVISIWIFVCKDSLKLQTTNYMWKRKTWVRSGKTVTQKMEMKFYIVRKLNLNNRILMPGKATWWKKITLKIQHTIKTPWAFYCIWENI